MRRIDALRWTLVPAAALLVLAGCSGEDDESAILPTRAQFEVTPPATDPLVFLDKNPADTTDTDDVVLVDVMLRATAGVTFSSFTLELTFDPGVVQIGQIDDSVTPLGNCDSPPGCGLLCADNVSPSSASPANTTGDLVLGVSAPLCTPISVSTPTRLLTITFVGASVGSTTLELVDLAGHGDCEILDAGNVAQPITCNAGDATITVTR
jgi:hypothetical protein